MNWGRPTVLPGRPGFLTTAAWAWSWRLCSVPCFSGEAWEIAGIAVRISAWAGFFRFEVFVRPAVSINGLLLTAIACLTSPAFSRAKTDVLVMKNGDHITGEVKKLEGGVLQVDLDYVDGTLAID